MIVVGLTGGIASGKSTVSAMFHKAGAAIIDADAIARQVVAPGLPAWQEIQSIFGEQVVDAHGFIDRTALGDLVFQDPLLRKQLEGIIHPRVRRQVDREMKNLQRTQPNTVVIQDIPLLLEAEMADGLCEIIVVYAPALVQLNRLISERGIPEHAALARIKAQMPMDDKCRRATIVINNSGPLSHTEKQVLHVYELLSQKIPSLL